MDAIYSFGLLVALVGGILAAVLSIVLVHRLFGHGLDSLEPMRATQFLMHHKAYLLVAVLCLLSFLAYSFVGSQGGKNESAG